MTWNDDKGVIDMKRNCLCPHSLVKILWFSYLVCLLRAQASLGGDAGVWGINAIRLQPVTGAAPSAANLLTNPCAVSLHRFYRAGGINLPVTPTECRITYNRSGLFVLFRCAETDMAFPAAHHGTNWFALLGSAAEEDSSFPDKVDLFVQPDMGGRFYYQFAVTLDGLKFGCQRGDKPGQSGEAAGTSARAAKVTAFDVSVTRETNAWLAVLRIPWRTLGGKPKTSFGLLPVRTRWRDGEVSSPVAFDFTEWPPPDLFIETHFGGGPLVQVSQTTLCRLPSGRLRWQRPALLSHPAVETVGQIWRMEQSLNQPTDKANFAERLYLTQCWINLLTLEGFNFRAGIGSIAEQGMEPYQVRREINAALRKRKFQKACQCLDAFLRKLDRTSSDWFADGSPGDILAAEWQPISQLRGLEVKANELLLLGLAGNHKVKLHLSLPITGGIRICGDYEGYFKPADSLPLQVVQLANSCSVRTGNGKVVISKIPFAISFYAGEGSPAARIGPDGIAFRFNNEGKVVAVDFKSRLDPSEVIYGFGEKYDHFNERGNVLTLWGMDDWFGNTAGLMNESYKPVPIFHSSRGYMIFDNSTYRLRADIGKTQPDQYRLTQQGPIFDYYFWLGPPEKAIQSYTALTGRPILPPKWAFEPWVGRTGRGWDKPSHDPVAEEEKVVEHFEKLDIPHSAIYAEGPSADSPALNQFMAAHRLKVLSWFYPVIPQPEQQRLMSDVKSDELPILHAQSNDVPWPLVDFTNPNALELCRRWWRHRLEIGVAGSMVDFGDRVPEDAVFYNGWRGDEMHNFYSYDYHRTYSKVFREKRGNDFILFGRAVAPGTQKWVAQFAGDHPANFAGLQAVLTGALNLCACGFSTWGSDLGGFLGWPEPAVYMRWTEFACFSPLMRSHGRTPREPWNYGDAAVANYKFYAWLRESLLNYIYNAAVEAQKTGIPIMRSMAVAFPSELLLASVQDQYLFGNDLLVAPIVTEKNSRTIRFPSGQWTSLWDGKTVAGPTNIQVSVPLDKIPVYLKPGAVVPIQLNTVLELGASLTPGRVNALIVTPPKQIENVAFLNAQEQSAGVTLQPTTNGFVLTLNNFPETNGLLVYDAAVTSVKVDGQILPKLTETELGSKLPGWQTDPVINRVAVRLPANQSRSQVIEVNLQPQAAHE